MIKVSPGESYKLYNIIAVYIKRHFRWTSSFDDNVFNDANFSGDKSLQKPTEDPFGGQSRYSGLDFHEDPFKNSNYRYADPFAENSDPFGAPDSQVFGADPFNSSSASDPFKSDTRDPFSAPAENNYENSKSINSDSFGNADRDPFGSSFTANFSSAPNKDPFGSGSFSGNDPFSLTNLKPVTSGLTTAPPEAAGPARPASSVGAVSSVGTTHNTVSYRKEKISSDSSVADKALKKKSSHSFSDFLTGSPLKLDKSDKKEKKEKKSGKFHLTSPLKTHKKESPTTDKKNKSSYNEKEADEV